MVEEIRSEEALAGEEIFTTLGDGEAEENVQNTDDSEDELVKLVDEETGARQPVRRQYRKVRDIVDDTHFFGERPEAEKEKRKTWEKLNQLYRKGEVIAAQVIEVRSNVGKGYVSIIGKIDDDFSVMIRDQEFFSRNAFKDNYYKADDAEKLKRRAAKARACIGAWISFVIIGMSADWGDDGKIVYTIIGDRIKAMELKRQRYFTGNNAVREGDTVTAEVLSVGEHLANLEVLGVECSVRENEIDAYSYIMDCRDALKPGDTLKVAVKRIHYNDDGSIGLNVSGATIGYREISAGTSQLKAGSSHQGIVKHVNMEKGIYTVITSGGASVLVRENAVIGREILMPGDNVTVTVKNVTPNIAYGTAQRR